MAHLSDASTGSVPLGASIPVVRRGSSTPGAPTRGGLADRWGRVATDLRISLLDKCNLRCQYCMPAEGLDWLPRANLMSADEIFRIADVGVRLLGVEEVRFTGGEPLVRADLVDIISRIHRAHPKLPISMTTNGIGLEKKVGALKEAGLSRINVSLDTICPQTFAELTRRDKLAEVLTGVDAAAAAGLHPIKINAVLMPGLNDTQGGELLAWALAGNYQLRFIEQMPLDADHKWTREGTVTAGEIREKLLADVDLAPFERPRGSSPAQLWNVYPKGTFTDTQAALEGSETTDAPALGQVGIIASVTEPFCSACTRTRITADGKIRSCLFSLTETDFLSALRAGITDEDFAQIWRDAMWGKPKAHGKDSAGFESADFQQPARSMSAIGG